MLFKMPSILSLPNDILVEIMFHLHSLHDLRNLLHGVPSLIPLYARYSYSLTQHRAFEEVDLANNQLNAILSAHVYSTPTTVRQLSIFLNRHFGRPPDQARVFFALADQATSLHALDYLLSLELGLEYLWRLMQDYSTRKPRPPPCCDALIVPHTVLLLQLYVEIFHPLVQEGIEVNRMVHFFWMRVPRVHLPGYQFLYRQLVGDLRWRLDLRRWAPDVHLEFEVRDPKYSNEDRNRRYFGRNWGYYDMLEEFREDEFKEFRDVSRLWMGADRVRF